MLTFTAGHMKQTCTLNSANKQFVYCVVHKFNTAHTFSA